MLNQPVLRSKLHGPAYSDGGETDFDLLCLGGYDKVPHSNVKLEIA